MLTQSGLLRIFPGTTQRAQCSELEDINLPGSQGFSLSLHPSHPPPKLSQWLGSEIRALSSSEKLNPSGNTPLLRLVRESSGKREKGRCVCLSVCVYMHARTHAHTCSCVCLCMEFLYEYLMGTCEFLCARLSCMQCIADQNTSIPFTLISLCTACFSLPQVNLL